MNNLKMGLFVLMFITLELTIVTWMNGEASAAVDFGVGMTKGFVLIAFMYFGAFYWNRFIRSLWKNRGWIGGDEE